jgi:hypothetical protein
VTRELRYQLRWAWAKLGCRCIFDRRHIKVAEDAHCPIHGWTFGGPADPEGWENVKP